MSFGFRIPRLPAISGLALLMGSAPAFAVCPTYPTEENVFAYECSATANFANGFTISTYEGHTYVSTNTSGPTRVVTESGGNLLQSGAFRVTGVPGQLSSKEYESTNEANGSSGSQSSLAGLGDAVHSISTIIPFAAGSTIVTPIRLSKNGVIPSLHAEAQATTSSSPGGAITVTSAAYAAFSDVISLQQNQIAAAGASIGQSLSAVYVTFTYVVHGGVGASPLNQLTPAFGNAEGDFSLGFENLTHPDSSDVGGSVDLSPLEDTDTLLGQQFTVTGRMAAGDMLQLIAQLSVQGSAVGAYGTNGSYNVDLGDTAQFEGVAFYADAGLTEKLPDMELSSEFGFDYAPSDAILSPVTEAVPETSTWAMLLAGFAGLAAAGYRRKEQRALS